MDKITETNTKTVTIKMALIAKNIIKDNQKDKKQNGEQIFWGES